MTVVTNERAVIVVYRNLPEVDEAVELLLKAGVAVKDISVVGRDRQAREAAEGAFAPPAALEQGLRREAQEEGFWIGGILGLLEGFGVFLVPGVGLLAFLGPLAGLVAGGGIGALFGNMLGELSSLDEASAYRERLIAGDLLVIVRCAPEEESRVRQALGATHALGVESHPYQEA